MWNQLLIIQLNYLFTYFINQITMKAVLLSKSVNCGSSSSSNSINGQIQLKIKTKSYNN